MHSADDGFGPGVAGAEVKWWADQGRPSTGLNEKGVDFREKPIILQ